MQRLDYHSPGPDDPRVRLRRWENWILLIALFILVGVVLFLVIGSL
jgi:hypothetical protein